MTRFRVSDGCTGLNMQSGKEYKAHNGYVDVDDPSDAAWVRKSFAAQTGFIDDKIRFHDVADDAPGCESCGFSAWGFSKVCSRCGADLEAQRANPGTPVAAVAPLTDVERARAAVLEAEAAGNLMTPRPKKTLIILPTEADMQLVEPSGPIAQGGSS